MKAIVPSLQVPRSVRWWFAGSAGALAGQMVLGLLFTSGAVRQVLFDPTRQSAAFLELAPTRDIPLSVAGLVVLGGIYGWLAMLVASRYPRASAAVRGLRLAALVWCVYWLPQEWFIYHTLLREPLGLCGLELVLLALGSLVTGLVTVRVLDWVERGRSRVIMGP